MSKPFHLAWFLQGSSAQAWAARRALAEITDRLVRNAYPFKQRRDNLLGF